MKVTTFVNRHRALTIRPGHAVCVRAYQLAAGNVDRSPRNNYVSMILLACLCLRMCPIDYSQLCPECRQPYRSCRNDTCRARCDRGYATAHCQYAMTVDVDKRQVRSGRPEPCNMFRIHFLLPTHIIKFEPKHVTWFWCTASHLSFGHVALRGRLAMRRSVPSVKSHPTCV